MHSKPGPGIADGSESFKNMWKHKKYWRSVRTIVLDEVSMVDAEFLDWIAATLRSIKGDRNNDDRWTQFRDLPCGGLQLVFCGDFHQLPPVDKSDKSLHNPKLLESWRRDQMNRDGSQRLEALLPCGLKELKGKWCFQTACWRDADFECVQLQKSFRTEDELLLCAMHELRRGHAGHPTVRKLLQSTARPLPPRNDGIRPTVLYAKKAAVELENSLRISSGQRLWDTLAPTPVASVMR